MIPDNTRLVRNINSIFVLPVFHYFLISIFPRFSPSRFYSHCVGKQESRTPVSLDSQRKYKNTARNLAFVLKNPQILIFFRVTYANFVLFVRRNDSQTINCSNVVCTFAQLCDCPQKALPKSPGQNLCKFLLFLLKSGIVAGLFCWTNYEGLWGSSSDVEDLYRRIMATIVPALDQKEVVTRD